MLVIDPDNLDAAITVLNQGGILALPTDTIYGLAAKYDHPAAVDKLIKIKDRAYGSGKVFILVPSSIDAISDFAVLSPLAKKLIHQYFPGDLTLELPKNPNFSNYYFDHLNAVGVRIPNHPIVAKLLPHTGPFLLTSANPRGDTPAQDSDTVQATLPDVDAVITGVADGRSPSTVAAIIDDKIIIRRQGDIYLS